MKRAITTSVILIVTSIITVYLAGGDDAAIKDITLTGNIVKRYEALGISATLPAAYKNPYDSREIELNAEITTPDKLTVIVPGFYSGQGSLWKARYTPARAGKYSYRLLLKSGSKKYASAFGHFEVGPGSSDGFLRKGKNNPFYPVFDSGKAFFGLGHNIAWTKDNDVSAYERYFAIFKENGCNITRIWINSPWTFALETKKLGVYNAADCEKVDAVIRLAENYGIYIILSLDSYAALMVDKGSWNEQWWRTNPYNSQNGGPCEKPWDFFTNEAAKKYYRDRLRYIIGRWGYSPNIIAFELWNELDAPAEWTKEMAAYIKSINPHGQFVTTSLGYPWDNNFDESPVWSMPQIDIVQRHFYGNRIQDVIENIITVNSELSGKYNKPVLVGEFGIDVNKNDADIDVYGNAVAFHNSLWAGALTRSFASSMNWWWDEYVKARNLYPHYRALKAFLNGVDWNSAGIKFLKATAVTGDNPDRNASRDDISVNTNGAWGETMYTNFTISNNGDCLGGIVNAYLHGTTKPNVRIEPVFNVNYPADGKFVIHVGMVSQGAHLVIYIDGKEALGVEFPAGQGQGKWKESKYRKDFNIYQCVYDTLVEVNVPGGAHVIKLSNQGKDWLDIRRITLTNYGSANFTNARVIGLRVGNDMMLVWAQNKEYNWQNDIRCIKPSVIKGAGFSVLETENGAYNLEWWDTYEGKLIAREIVTAQNGQLPITLPEFSKDIACKITRLRSQ